MHRRTQLMIAIGLLVVPLVATPAAATHYPICESTGIGALCVVDDVIDRTMHDGVTAQAGTPAASASLGHAAGTATPLLP